MMKRFLITVAFLVFTVPIHTEPASGTQFQIGAFTDTHTARARAKLLKNWDLDVQYGRSPEGYIRVTTKNLPRRKSKKIRAKLKKHNVDYYEVPDVRTNPNSGTAPTILQSKDTTITTSTLQGKSKFTQKIKRALDQEYKWGSASLDRGFDCSGLVQWVFDEQNIPRTVQEQWQWSQEINSGRLKKNDLLFFQFDSRQGPDHVGIYRSESHFYHASVKYGVTRADLTNAYYIRNLWGVGRIKKNNK